MKIVIHRKSKNCYCSAFRLRPAWSDLLAAIAWTASLIAMTVVISWVARVVAVGAIVEKKEINVALAATLDGLLTNSACPRDPAAIQEAAENLFVIMNPALAQMESRKDAAFIQAEAAAASSFFNPGALHAKKMADPAYRRKYEAAMDSFQRQAKETDLPIKPTATDAKQIEALRNDLAWRRQREEPMRALMPVGQARPLETK